MNAPHEDEFFNTFHTKTDVLALGLFGYISAPSWKCHLAPYKHSLVWDNAARIYLGPDYISITNECIDRRFKRKFKYENYFTLEELLDDLIPYMTNIIKNHNGWSRRNREMAKFMKTQAYKDILEASQTRVPHS